MQGGVGGRIGKERKNERNNNRDEFIHVRVHGYPPLFPTWSGEETCIPGKVALAAPQQWIRGEKGKQVRGGRQNKVFILSSGSRDPPKHQLANQLNAQHVCVKD